MQIQANIQRIKYACVHLYRHTCTRIHTHTDSYMPHAFLPSHFSPGNSVINDLLVRAQALTADPKTDSKLGKVGRG